MSGDAGGGEQTLRPLPGAKWEGKGKQGASEQEPEPYLGDAGWYVPGGTVALMYEPEWPDEETHDENPDNDSWDWDGGTEDGSYVHNYELAGMHLGLN